MFSSGFCGSKVILPTCAMLSQSSVAEMLPKSSHQMGLSRNSTSKACQQTDTRLCIKQAASYFSHSLSAFTKP